MKIKVLIVDDHAVLRNGLRLLIDSQSDMIVVSEAADGAEAITEAMTHRPDVVLMDISMPGGRNGIYTTDELLKCVPDVKVLILSMHDNDQYLFQTLKAGASGYILKTAPSSELLKAIREVYRGQAYLYPTAARKIIDSYLQFALKENTDVYEQLSEREKEIFDLVVKGYTNKEIGDLLLISAKTVENHKGRIMDKLELRSRRDLMRFAAQRGLLDFDE